MTTIPRKSLTDVLETMASAIVGELQRIRTIAETLPSSPPPPPSPEYHPATPTNGHACPPPASLLSEKPVPAIVHARSKAAARAERYRRRKGISARSSSIPPLPIESSVLSSTAGLVVPTSTDIEAMSISHVTDPPPTSTQNRDASRLLRTPNNRDASRSKPQSVTPDPTTRAGFTSSLRCSENLTASGSPLLTSSSLLDRKNLSGHDSRARANPTSTHTEADSTYIDANPPALTPEETLAEASAGSPTDGPSDADDRGNGRRTDRQVWLGVDRCAYAFHAVKCDDDECRAAGAYGQPKCRSKRDWLGFATRGRGGRPAYRNRMYDAVRKALGAVQMRVPSSTPPHDRLVLVVEAFLLHATAGRPWATFGDYPLRMVDAALAVRLQRPERPSAATPRAPVSAVEEGRIARELAARAAAARVTLQTAGERDASRLLRTERNRDASRSEAQSVTRETDDDDPVPKTG